MDQIPYKLLIMWGGVIPDYGDSESGNSTSNTSEKSMSMFDMVANLQQGKGI